MPVTTITVDDSAAEASLLGTCDRCRGRRDRGETVEYHCPECGECYDYEPDAENCGSGYYCAYCDERYEHQSSAEECGCCAPEDDESYGDDSYEPLPPLDDIYRLAVAAIPGRPARLCSIEQEVTRGGYAAATMLYNESLSDQPERASYNADCRPGRMIVKEDGSLPGEGGEIIYSRFLLDMDDDIAALSTGLARIRQLKDQGVIRSGESAGTHVHIAARADSGETFQPQQMAALHELFCHLEDMLYALAACGWDEHRLSPYGGGYCKALPKCDGPTTPAKVHRVMRTDRYLGLNYGRLFESVQQCRCGACIVGAWDECDCGALNDATIEWRLFNSSTKPETIHAWVLIAHALTAYAAQHAWRLGTLEPTTVRSGTPESRWAQLEWMLDECPFTEDERQVIRRAARRSPGFGERSDTY